MITSHVNGKVNSGSKKKESITSSQDQMMVQDSGLTTSKLLTTGVYMEPEKREDLLSSKQDGIHLKQLTLKMLEVLL